MRRRTAGELDGRRRAIESGLAVARGDGHPRRGRLAGRSSAPSRGERVEELARIRNLVVEHVLSGELEGPVDYRQDEDEFVVVLAGSAVLEVEGERLDVVAGDWLVLPAGTPHRLLRTEPGTSWLAVHLGPPT